MQNEHLPNTITLTAGTISACESLANSYTRETLAAFGISWPPRVGWKARLIGTTITNEKYQAALNGRSRRYFAKHQPMTPRHCTDKQLVEITRDALADWRRGKLTAEACCMAIATFYNPQPITADDLKWAKSVIVTE